MSNAQLDLPRGIDRRDSRALCLDGLLYDLRFAIRGLRRDRALTLAGIAMLTLGIGLNLTVFTVMNAMLFRGLALVKQEIKVPGAGTCYG